ncbi:hypothetical protein WJX74_006570 [Apatococcus lobatus]|uniref:Tubulin-tyrosine ligase n=1 Tax=Apatococcus lobatus TaxID=904363 RepID=A0AAW1RPQ0_9CHLO
MIWRWDERAFEAAQQPRPQSETQPARLKAVVCLEDEYVSDLVLDAFRRRPDWIVSTSADAAASADGVHQLWVEYELINWGLVHQGDLRANCYCIRKGLIRKAQLAVNLKNTLRRLCVRFLRQVRDMADGSAIWIAKPSITNQGAGICVFDRVSTLQAAVEAAEDLHEWVVQRYIDRPLLVDGRKFHLRAYVLCVGSLTAYVFDEILVLCAPDKYDAALRELGNQRSHLTNTCLQTAPSEDPHGDVQDPGTAEDLGLIKLLSELPQVLANEGQDLQVMQRRCRQASVDVQNVIGECMEAVSHELTFFTLPNCFELFGFDLLVDEDWRVWLLEANAEPDFRQTGDRLRPVVAGVVEGTMQTAVDSWAAQELGRTCNVQPSSTQRLGAWQEVFCSQVAGRQGVSGMSMS